MDQYFTTTCWRLLRKWAWPFTSKKHNDSCHAVVRFCRDGIRTSNTFRAKSPLPYSMYFLRPVRCDRPQTCRGAISALLETSRRWIVRNSFRELSAFLRGLLRNRYGFFAFGAFARHSVAHRIPTIVSVNGWRQFFPRLTCPTGRGNV